jgi:inorganic pyrophosphatase
MYETKHFFEVYKTLEGKTTFVERFDGAEKARAVIAKCIAEYKEHFNK